MLIVSQNLLNYDVKLKSNTVYRVNLAWTTLKELKKILRRHSKKTIFFDLPINRIKPPNNSYSIDELVLILKNYTNIKYLAISNVEKKEDVFKYKKIIPNHVMIVPKIESPDGISNVSEIVKAIPSQEKVLMLDHEDLFSSLTKLNESPSQFKDYINNLTKFCVDNEVILLRTIGVIFSDEEKRVTQYIN